VLKKVLKLYADKGWQPIVAPEMEFYLTKRSEDPDFRCSRRWAARPPKPVVSRSPSKRPTNSTRCSKTSTTGANCRLDLDTLIHEDGPAQMEINFRHGDALDLADQILVFNAPCAKPRSSTTWPPPSWPSR
jgi:glutamine synthetase